MRGRQPATFVRTDYGDVQIIRSRYVPLTRAYLVTFDGRICRRIMRPMGVKMMGVYADSEDLMFTAEETLEVKGASQFTRFTGLTTA